MTDLLPCPFCGCVPKLINPGYHGDKLSEEKMYDVACGTEGCFLEWGADWLHKRDEIIAMWNKRDTIGKELR